MKIADPSSPTSPVWTQVNRSAAVSAAGVTQQGTPLDSLLEKSFGEAKAGIESALITGIGTGQGWSWVADQMMKAADVPYERAVRIARSEINRSLREASYQSYKNSGVALGYRRMCFKPTACLACLMLDGEFTPLDAGPLSDHPNGKCTQVAVTRHYDPIDHGWQTGREWLELQDEETQRRIMGAGRFELWKSSGVDPKSMVYMKDNPIWGSQPGIHSVKQLQINYFFSANASRPISEPSFMQQFVFTGDTPNSANELLRKVNPNYTSSIEYQENCQRCVVAYEMQWRGYDVEARPYDPNDPIGDNCAICWDIDLKNYSKDPYGFAIFRQPQYIKPGIADLFDKWGDGARAAIRVKWKKGGRGHIFTIRREAGILIYEDPQTGEVRDIDQTIAELSSELWSTWLMRIDNRPIKQEATYAVKNRKNGAEDNEQNKQ